MLFVPADHARWRAPLAEARRRARGALAILWRPGGRDGREILPGDEALLNGAVILGLVCQC